MKKLEEIPKKTIFTIPDNYFDTLPGIIQSRTSPATKIKKPFFSYALQYGLPVVLVALILIWFIPSVTIKNQEAESLLAAIQTEDLIAYLNDSELNTDEVVEVVEFNADDLDEIEDLIFEIDLNQKESENIFDEIN